MLKADKTLDIKGLAGSKPKAITENTLKSMGPGQVLMVIATDRTTKQSIPPLCEALGCSLLEVKEDAGTLYFAIQR